MTSCHSQVVGEELLEVVTDTDKQIECDRVITKFSKFRRFPNFTNNPQSNQSHPFQTPIPILISIQSPHK